MISSNVHETEFRRGMAVPALSLALTGTNSFISDSVTNAAKLTIVAA